MAFNINAQVILSGPKNIQKVRSSISKQLAGVTVDVNLKVPKNAAADLGKLNSSLNTLNATLSSLNKNATTATTALNSLSKAGKNLGNFSKNLSSQNQKASKSLDSVGSSAAKAGSQLEEFGKDAALAVRRFSAFTIATGAVFGLVRAVSNATSESIKFERELARVVQVTGATDKQLKGLTSTIDGLSTSLGLDANKLLEVSVTFAQTGQSIDQVAKSIKAVSRASLAATFGDIQKTTEGVIAALAQFNLSAGKAESVLGSLNAVSKSFAVEADDLISVIRRAGGVFAASSAQLGAPEERLRELIGIFTAVRSTTRESADTIATGLRTIFTRIQRPQTIKFLEQFGVQLRATAADARKFGLAEGDFVGIFESLKRISAEIGGLDTLQLAKVVEELGGVRQVGKLLPALREFEKAERARGVALAGTGSISKDVAIATKTLAVQIENLQQRFGKLIRDVSQSQTFQTIAKTAVSAANAILTLTDALRPALPLLTAFAGIKLAGAAFDFSKGFVGGLKKGGGAGGVGAAVGNIATAGAGSAGKQNAAAKQASDKQVIAALGKNTIATDKNTQALTTLNTTQSTLVTSANALATQSTQLIAALNKLPAILLRGGGGGSRPLPIRRRGGGSIPKFAKGGFVNGPSHAQGGVIAELEGGEFVVPKKDAKRQGFAKGTGKGGVQPERQLTDIPPSQRQTRGAAGSPKNTSSKNAFKQVARKIQSENTILDGDTAGIFILQDSSSETNQLSDSSKKSRLVGNVAGKAVKSSKEGKFEQKIFDENKAFYRQAYIQGNKLVKQDGTARKGSEQRVNDIIAGNNDAVIVKSLKFDQVAGEFPILRLQSKEAIGEDPQIKTLFNESAKEALKVGVEQIYASDLIEKISPNVGSLKLQDGKNFKVDKLFGGATETIEGYLLEGLVGGLADIPIGGGQADLDFPNINAEAQKRMQNLFGDAALGVALGDGKRSASGNESAVQAKLKADFVKGNALIGFSPFGAQLAATGGRIGLQSGGMVPVAVSNGEGFVDAATASRIMPLLERARAGDGSAIQALAGQRNIIQDIVGAGTGTSDSIKTNLAAGSFVLQKSIMDRIDGQRQNAATGGVIRGKLAGGGVAGLASSAAGLAFGASSLASGDILGALFSLSLFKDELVNLKSNFKEVTKSTKKLIAEKKGENKVTKRQARLARKAGRANKPSVPGQFGGRVIKGEAISRADRIARIKNRSVLTRRPGLGAFGRTPLTLGGRGDLLKSSLTKAGTAKALKGAKFTIGAFVANLLVDPLLDGVEKGLLGAKEKIGDFEGFTKEQGGLTTARAVGGTRGAITGALTGASIGSLIPIPVLGTAIGAAAGAVIGGVIGQANAANEQRRFQTLKDAQLSGTNLSRSLEALAKSGSSNTEALNRTTLALTKFTNDIENKTGAFRSTFDGNFGQRFTDEEIQRQREDQVTEGFADPTGIAILFKALFGDEKNKSNVRNINLDAAATSNVLDSIPDQLFEDAEKSRQNIQGKLFDSIATEDLGVLSNLGNDADFDDLQNALKSVSDGTELFAERLKNLQAAQSVRNRQLQKEQKLLLDPLIEGAKDNPERQAFFNSAINAATDFARTFDDTGSVKKAIRESNKRFAIDLRASQPRGQSSFAELFNRGGSQSDGGIGKFNAEVARAVSIGKLTDKLRVFATDIGVSEEELFNLIQTQSLFTENASRSSAAALKAAAQQRELEAALLKTAKGVDAFSTALTRLVDGISNAISNFGLTNQNVQKNVSGILANEQNISAVARGNVFNDPNASISDLRSGVKRVGGAIGGGQGFEDLAGVVSLRDQLPSLLKDIVDQAKASGTTITDVEFVNQIKAGLKGFDQLPQSVQNSIVNAAKSTFQGTRQDASGNALAGADEIERLLEGGALKEFLAVSDQAAESLSKVTDTLNTFDALILESANLQIQSTRQLVDSQLKVLDKINSFEDRFDKFGNSAKDPLSIATLRVQQRTALLLESAGAGGGALENVGGGDLLRRRKGLEDIIEDINVKIGQRTDVDPADTASLAKLDNDEINSLVKQLADTTSALEGTKKAIDVLANDTTELAAVEGKLASINESRLTGRQKLTALFGQLANAKNPFDRAKILQEFQRPVLAQIKANQGQALTPQEFFSLQQDLFQGPNGLIGLIQKNVFGRSNEEINQAIENALAGNQLGGIDFLQRLGLNIAPAVFGGAAATVRGTTPEEIALLEKANELLARSAALTLGVADANADAIAKQQEILRIELIKTKDALSATVIEFQKLRDTLLSFAPNKAPAIPVFIPPGGATDEFGNPQSVTGGLFDQYFNRGGMARNIFKPKGTDTVPAMLTPGEFVMSKPAVKRIGVGNLKMLNSLSGPKTDRVLYAQDGGYTQSDYSPIIVNRTDFIAEFGKKAFDKRYLTGNKNITGLYENSKSERQTTANSKLLERVDATFARAAEKLGVPEGKVLKTALDAFKEFDRQSSGSGGQTGGVPLGPISQQPFSDRPQIDDQSTPKSKSSNVLGSSPFGPPQESIQAPPIEKGKSPSLNQEEANRQFEEANRQSEQSNQQQSEESTFGKDGIDIIQERGRFDIKRSQELLDEIKQYNTPEARKKRDKEAAERAKKIPTNPMIAEGNRLLDIASKNLDEAQAEAERLDKSFDRMLNDPFFDQIDELDKTGKVTKSPDQAPPAPPLAQAPPAQAPPAQAPPIKKGKSPTLKELEQARKFEEEQIKEQAELSGQTVEELKSQIRLQELYNEAKERGLIDIKNVNGTFQYVVTELGKAKGVIKNDFGGFDNILGEQGPTGEFQPANPFAKNDPPKTPVKPPVEKGKSPSFDDIRNDYFRDAEALGVDPFFLSDEENAAADKAMQDLRDQIGEKPPSAPKPPVAKPPVNKGQSGGFNNGKPFDRDQFGEFELPPNLQKKPSLNELVNDAIQSSSTTKSIDELVNSITAPKISTSQEAIDAYLDTANKNVDFDDFIANFAEGNQRVNPSGDKDFPFIGGGSATTKEPRVSEAEAKEKTIREKKLEQKRKRDERKKRDRENPNNPEKLAADKRREEQRKRNQAIIDDPDSSEAAKKQARARQQELDARDNEGLSEQGRRLNQRDKLEERIKRFEEEAAASDDPSKFEGKLRTARENLRKINKSIAEYEKTKREQESDLPPKPRPPVPFFPDGDPFGGTTDEFGNPQSRSEDQPPPVPFFPNGDPFGGTTDEFGNPQSRSEDQPKIPVPPKATVPDKSGKGVFGGDCCDQIVKLLQKIADCVCSGKTTTPPTKTLQKPSVPKPDGKIGLVPQKKPKAPIISPEDQAFLDKTFGPLANKPGFLPPNDPRKPSSRNTIAPIDGLVPQVPKGAIREQDNPKRLPGSSLPKNSRSVTLAPTRNDGQSRSDYLRNKYLEQQNLRANRAVSNRRGFNPRRSYNANRAIQGRNERYQENPDFSPLGTNRGNLPSFQYQGGRGNPKGSYLNRANDGAQIQGATELNQSLTQMATVSQQLNSAADKLASLPALEITINGKIAPVEVVLNGTQMLAEFKETFMNEVRLMVGNAIIAQNTSLTNPVV